MTATGCITLVVTGTDTGVGKTRLSTALLRAARRAGIDAVAYKPVASGCEQTEVGWRNDDALQLMAAADNVEPYERINPYALPQPIAPHLAARAIGRRIDTAVLDAGYDWLAARHQCVLIEGAGGWQVPLNESTDFADWVAARRWPVLLVVGLRLGCINHALLSAAAISARTKLFGWVANQLPPLQENWADNLASLRERLAAPCLGVLPEHGDEVAADPVMAAVLERLRLMVAVLPRDFGAAG